MQEQKKRPGILCRVAALASGALLLQASSCTVDEALLTELLNLALETFLTASVV